MTEFKFDPEAAPSGARPVVVLRGSWREMGVQLGQCAREAVHANAAAAAAAVVRTRGSVEAALGELPEYIEMTRAVFPQLVDCWQGIAEGAGLAPEYVYLTHITMAPPGEKTCSTVSAWGGATKGGTLLCAVNADGTVRTNQYYPAVIAWPEDGHVFIAPLGLMTNTYLNDAGLVVMASAGQNEKTPFARAVPIMCAELYAAAFCAGAEEAAQSLIDGRMAGGGSNAHLADGSGACIVEYTHAKHVLRRPGDHGERDYMIAANHFVSEKMRDELFTGPRAWPDSPHRYRAEEAGILARYGEHTPETMRALMAETRRLGEDGAWVDEWEPTRGEWTPENRGPGYKTYSRHVVDAAERTMYVLAGSQQLPLSNIPDATGTFWALRLEDSPEKCAAAAEAALQSELWRAARDVSATKAADAEGLRALSEAKRCLYAGINHSNLALCAADERARLAEWSRALTALCRGQCLAKLAQNEPQRLNPPTL